LKVTLAVLIFLSVAAYRPYAWKERLDPAHSLDVRVQVPAGYSRVAVEDDSFGSWLRSIPLKPGKPEVKLYNGELKNRQDVHVAVVDMDVGTRDLQQCADAVIRLRSEYLYSRGNYEGLHFNFTNNFRFDYDKWRQGFRVKVEGNKTSWIAPTRASVDESYPTFKKYLNLAFSYCGTLSLSKEMKSISVSEISIGDVFIRGGSPGHAVIVMDVARNANGKKIFLLGQSYMPAQEFHILVNPNDLKLSPWYEADFAGSLTTPEWVFERDELMRF
jgi:hypothetical protein